MDLLTPQFPYQFILEDYFSLWYSHSNPVWTGTSLTWSLSTLLQHQGFCSSHHNLKKKQNYSSLKSAQTQRERSQDKDELKKPNAALRVSQALCYTKDSPSALQLYTFVLVWFVLSCVCLKGRQDPFESRWNEQNRGALFAVAALKLCDLSCVTEVFVWGVKCTRTIWLKMDGRRSIWRTEFAKGDYRNCKCQYLYRHQCNGWRTNWAKCDKKKIIQTYSTTSAPS